MTRTECGSFVVSGEAALRAGWESDRVSTTVQRIVVLMRHAEAETSASSDFERRLTSSGRAAAVAAGRALAAAGVSPDVALVSSAQRTRETWDAVVEGAGWTVGAQFDEALYSADTDTVTDLVNTAPEDARTVLVLGHNPTVAMLASLLDAGDGPLELSMRLARQGFPPSSAVVFEFEGTWWDVREGRGELRDYFPGA